MFPGHYRLLFVLYLSTKGPEKREFSRLLQEWLTEGPGEGLAMLPVRSNLESSKPQLKPRLNRFVLSLLFFAFSSHIRRNVGD
jgi:hypothetical protein